LDTPKTNHSIRKVALSEGLRSILNEWRARAVNDQPDGWLFPSETLKTPVIRDNCWRRHIATRLGEDLGWVNFHVMRRTHSSLMRELDVDPKVVAEQLGHTLDVNLNIYTDAGFQLRKKAVNILEASLRSSDGVEMEYVN